MGPALRISADRHAVHIRRGHRQHGLPNSHLQRWAQYLGSRVSPAAVAEDPVTIEATRLQRSVECVALVRVAGLVAGRKPALTLLR
jgi:hypothetical protein